MSRDYSHVPVPFTDVVITGGMWLSRINMNSATTVPYTLDRCEDTGRVSNFEKAAGSMPGDHQGHRYNDSDLFKVIEGCAYTLAANPDPALRERVNEICVKIAAAQESDGYLYTLRTIHPTSPGKDAGDSRWSALPVNHELYNVGHLYEAAVAHYHTTGERVLLDVARKNADLLLRTFGVDGIHDCPGHQEIEIGLVKLYRTFGNLEYLELAKFFLEQRGRLDHGWYDQHKVDLTYTQSHAPVTEQSEAVGHAVRAVYMYSGMADVAALTEDRKYLDAITRIWDDVVGSKLYITGGVGARHEGEAFGDRFELPNQTAYAETCAAIAMLFWSHRMFLLTGAGSYMDVFERTLYNGFLAGVGLSGDRFFYSNPLESDGQWPFNQGHTDRQPWFECSCCPTNVVRFMPSLSGYVYAVRGDAVFVNLYMASEATVPIADTQIGLQQETDYPWDGSVRITVTPISPASFDLHFRIPGWARDEPAPGNLYRYADDEHPSVSLRINGSAAEARTDSGYLVVRRSWQAGDVVELLFDMPIRRVATDPRVEANRGKLALERGPVVYCFEEIDNPASIESASLSSPFTFRSEMREDLLGGIVTLTDDSLTAVPYFSWANRGSGRMRVWVPDSPEV